MPAVILSLWVNCSTATILCTMHRIFNLQRLYPVMYCEGAHHLKEWILFERTQVIKSFSKVLDSFLLKCWTSCWRGCGRRVRLVTPPPAKRQELHFFHGRRPFRHSRHDPCSGQLWALISGRPSPVPAFCFHIWKCVACASGMGAARVLPLWESSRSLRWLLEMFLKCNVAILHWPTDTCEFAIGSPDKQKQPIYGISHWKEQPRSEGLVAWGATNTCVCPTWRGERGVDSKQRSFSMVWGRAETDLELKRGSILWKYERVLEKPEEEGENGKSGVSCATLSPFTAWQPQWQLLVAGGLSSDRKKRNCLYN